MKALVAALLLGLPCWACAEAISFDVCSLKTCKLPDPSPHLLGARFAVLSSEVIAVSELDKCTECSAIRIRSGNVIFVRGSVSDVACQIFGGISCQDTRK